MPNTSIFQLVALLDKQEDKELRVIEDQIVALGDAAVAPILESVTAINQRQKQSINPLYDILALERRIRVLGRIKSPIGMRAVLDALADSAIAVDDCKAQKNAAHDAFMAGGDGAATYNIILMADLHIDCAKALNAASIEALVAYGQDAIPFILKYIDKVPRPVQRALKKAELWNKKAGVF